MRLVSSQASIGRLLADAHHGVTLTATISAHAGRTFPKPVEPTLLFQPHISPMPFIAQRPKDWF